ncbi:MAG TPA: glycine cleavage system protein GcvH [Acidobacteria bacterium]|jgi:glycine cleavage system H protein|nr:glycine cleavage system protein GcvH [Acidobacteriota bacterium]|tara:strand:+ start:459 stop:830 length:372 start_codon:yes stop_codon:yes gene_type:complete
MYPNDRKYSKDHEWVQTTDSEARIGITHYAQEQLGDVVYVELPKVGRIIRQGEIFGTIESVKAVSELYSPMSGEVTGVNSELVDHPELVNGKPHEAWMIVVKPSNLEESSELMDATAYSEHLK